MRKTFVAAGCVLAATSTALAWEPASAQAASAAAGGTCYIEVGKLVTPTGIAELSAAMLQLDEALRPQVEQIAYLQQEIAGLEAPRVPGVQLASDTGIDQFGRPRPSRSADGDPLSERLHRRMELDAKQRQLRLSYAEQMRAIVGPVQARISAGATAFGAERGCAAMKMARAPELAALRGAGGRDLTADFVSWYASNKD